MKRMILALLVFIVVVSWSPDQMLQAQQTGTYSIQFQWTIPTENEDGSVLTNLAGFRLYQSSVSGSYTTPVVDIANPSISIYTLDNVDLGEWYFVVTAYNSDGVESVYSNEVVKTIAVPPRPKAPTGFLALN